MPPVSVLFSARVRISGPGRRQSPAISDIKPGANTPELTVNSVADPAQRVAPELYAVGLNAVSSVNPSHLADCENDQHIHSAHHGPDRVDQRGT